MYVTTVVEYLADKAPSLLKVLRETDPGHVLLDGTLAECDRAGDGRADSSTKHKRHGVRRWQHAGEVVDLLAPGAADIGQVGESPRAARRRPAHIQSPATKRRRLNRDAKRTQSGMR